MRSPSVFNFYEPDYQPPGNEFVDSGKSAPEISIIDTSSLVKYSNTVWTALHHSDLPAFAINSDQFRQSMQKQRHKWNYNIRINTYPLLNLFELGLEMDTLGDFKSLKNTKEHGLQQRRYALSLVLNVLEDQFLGFDLEHEYREQLLNRITQPVNKKPPIEARRMISSLIHTLVTGPDYWVMR